MPHIEKSGVIDAPVDEVFSRLADRENAVNINTKLNRVWDIEPEQACEGQTWKWEISLLGLTFEGTAEMTDYEENSHLSFHTSGKVESDWTYSVEETENGTEVTVEVDYELPESILAKIADSVVLSSVNELSAEEMIINLRAQVE